MGQGENWVGARSGTLRGEITRTIYKDRKGREIIVMILCIFMHSRLLSTCWVMPSQSLSSSRPLSMSPLPPTPANSPHSFTWCHMVCSIPSAQFGSAVLALSYPSSLCTPRSLLGRENTRTWNVLGSTRYCSAATKTSVCYWRSSPEAKTQHHARH